LYVELKKEIIMKIPESMDAARKDCLSLNKTVYGLVQSASRHYIMLVEVLKSFSSKAVGRTHIFGQGIVHLE
jgi:hypothetical protein